MTSDTSLGRDTQLIGRPQNDLGEWMLNQQRQFQEFDRSFHTTPGFGDSFGDFFSSPFSRTTPAIQSHQPAPQSPTHALSASRVPDRAMAESNDMSPKAKVSYDQDKFQVEFNVQDYRPEELSIKTEGDVLIVLAKHETKAEGGQSFVSKQFEQRFSLPSGVKMEKIASSLSKDGVLTVSAPRENLPISNYQQKGEIENKNGQVYSQSDETKQSEGLPQPKVSYDDDKFQISLDVKSYSPEDLDVKVEGNSIIITAKQEIKESGGTRTRVFEQKFSLPSGVKAELVKSSLTREGVLVITAPRGNVVAKQAYTETVDNKTDKVLDPNSWEKERTRDSAFDDRSRVSAFDDKRIDSAFDDMRKGSAFDSALSSTRQGSLFDTSRPSLFDDRSIFDRDRSHSLFDRDDRSLFAANSEQNGISRVQYDDDTYKILVNVEKFKPEELVIKTVDNTIIVEAKHEEKTTEGRSYSTQSFNQSFTLPKGVNPESVTSALSKEGVLTISAPLPKSLKSSSSERLVPIKHY
eukprot:GFUD01005168.1.p1 GENE.GFUD01005168.1~~GFUD01005168.1.p1  ORF type:complete len:521 (-),score=138.30 GFUD01005168.1:487-2049(-)